MPLPNITTLTTQPTVGEYYLVPCIHYRGIWAPVIGSLHADAEIGFPQRHWHYDFRFVGPTMAGALFGVYGDTLEENLPRLSGYVIGLHELPDGDSVAKEGPQLRRKRCVRAHYAMPATLPRYDGGVARNPLIKKLEPIWKDACIADLENPVCPHKRVPLAGQPVDENNCVRCPAHGLMFSLTTGKLVRQVTCEEKTP